MNSKVTLFYALLLSRARQAAIQVVFPLFGYQILVERDAYDAYRLQIAFAATLEEPHIDEHFADRDALVLFLDEWDIPCDGWYPVDEPDDDDGSEKGVAS